mgnify:CR=1 FL=1
MTKLTDDVFRKSTNGQFKCPDEKCDKTFPSIVSARMHYNRMHGGIGRQQGLKSGQFKEKRKYTKRSFKNHQFSTNFCPNCGCSILAVHTAINLTKM